MQEYLEAIRRRVCAVCIDADEHGVCQLGPEGTCPVERFLPEVIGVVNEVQSDQIEDYVAVLRDRICAFCQQTPEGLCALRLKADCALDRYFVLVAEAIDEVQRQQEPLFQPA